jgi:hypothetical protein
MRDDYWSSKNKRYLMYPKSCALFEHEYDVDLSNSEWKKIADEVEQCLRNFYGSEMFAFLKELPIEKWLEVENFSFFYLDDIKIWAVLDCSFQTDDGITIIDWKTGRTTSKDISLQLSCYAMYCQDKWRVRPEDIKLIEYNLLSDQKAEFTITEGEIKDTTSYIKGSVADMRSLLLDVENNVPKDERFFKKVGDERIRNRCNFKKVCDL